MTPDGVYSGNEEWFRDYDEAAEAAHHNEQLIQQQREERKMAFEPRDNHISIFKNKYKTEERHPNLTGKGLIGGTAYEVAAWKKTDKNGNPFLSLKFELPRDNGRSYSKPKEEEDFDF